MRRFTIRNDMVQRIATLVLCCLLTTTLLSSPTFAEETKKKEATPSIATPKVEPPKNESNRRMGQVEPPKNESTRRMGHAGPMRHINKHWQQQQPQHRQFIEEQQFHQPQQTQTQTVYIALDSQHESSENRAPRLVQAPRPRSGPRRLRKRIRRPQQQSQAQHYYSPAVVQSMPLPIHGPTGYSQNGAATHMHVISSPTVATDPKNYAFAYAVRDTDPYNGDDFSHKEARDGKLTMGEYKVVLPDGRTQVVRYTAGNNQGFKADVTYEDEEAPVRNVRGRTRKPKHGGNGGSYHSTPTTTVHKQYAAPPSPSHSAANPYKNPIYFSRPIKSPQIVFRSNDNEYKNRYQHENQISISATPSPNIVFKAGPSSRPRLPPPSQATFINGLVTSTRPFHGPKSIYDKMAHMPIQSLKYSKPLGHLNHDKSPRAGPLRSASPGVATPTQATYTSLRPSSPTPLSQFDTHSAYSHPGNELSINRPYKFKLSSQTPTISYNIVDAQNSVSPTPIYADYNPTGKSKLIPVEYFKAGPATESSPVQQGKVRKLHRRLRPLNNPLHQEHYHTALSSVKTSPTPIYHKQQIHSTHSSYVDDDHHSNHYHREINSNEHHHDQRHHTQQQYLPVSTYASPTVSSASAAPQSHQSSYYYNSLHGPDSHEITHTAFPRVKSSLATFTASFPGTKAPLYYKSQPQYPVGRPVRPSTGGLVYLETPGKGLRPTTLGVKESLDQRLPIPHATTSTHPYEVGSADYGKSVGYSNFEGDQQNDPNKKDFTPSEEIPPEFVPHLNQRYNNNHHSRLEDGQHLQHHQVDDIHSFMREYLIDDTKDSIVGAPEQQLDTRLGHLDQASEYAFRF